MDKAYSWLTPAQAAAVLNIHPETLRQRSAELPAGCVKTTPGGHRRYRADLLRDLPLARKEHPAVWQVSWQCTAHGASIVALPKGLSDERLPRIVVHALVPDEVRDQAPRNVELKDIDCWARPDPFGLTVEAVKASDKRAQRYAQLLDTHGADNGVRAARVEFARRGDKIEDALRWRVTWSCTAEGTCNVVATNAEQACELARGQVRFRSAKSLYRLLVESIEAEGLGSNEADIVWPQMPRLEALTRLVKQYELEFAAGTVKEHTLNSLRTFVGNWDSIASLLDKPKDEILPQQGAA